MLLKPDKIMKGSITKIIEECWKETNKGNKKHISLEEFRNIHELIVEYDKENKEIFIDIVESVHIKIEDIGKSHKNFINPMKCLGVVLDENIYAGCGRFNYIYRCKGNRSVWFKDGTIKEYSVYCTIDQSGFGFSLCELDSLNLLSEQAQKIFTEEIYYDMTIYKLKNVEYVLKRLFNINKAYIKDYYLEYIINPPDVDILSDFSLNLRKEIWDSILDLGKRAIEGNDDEKSLFKYCIEFMTKIGIKIEIESLIEIFSYITKKQKSYTDIKWIIECFEKKIDENNKSDIIEVKPGIGGISLNLNEVFRRIKKIIKKNL